MNTLSIVILHFQSSEQLSQVVSVLSLSFVILEGIEIVESRLKSGLYRQTTFETAIRDCKTGLLNLLCALRIQTLQTSRRISVNTSETLDNIPSCLLGRLNDGCYDTQVYVFLKDASQYIQQLRNMLASK